jgi:hypothetical protein
MVAANWLGDTLLLWVVLNGLFLWTPIYEAKKDVIDNTCNKLCQNITNLKNKVDAVIPKYKD